MKNSKLITATAVFSVAITAAVTTMSITSAFRGDMSQNGIGQQNPQLTQEQRTEIKTALENKDYKAWLELAPENGRYANVTEAEFQEFAEEHLARIEKMETRRTEMQAEREAFQEALKNKDYDTWQELQEQRNQRRNLTQEEFNQRAEHFAEREAHREAVKEAIENGDYTTWAELISENGRNPQILEVINADNFDQLKEIHELKEAGNFEEAREKASELGIEPNRKKGQGQKNYGKNKKW